MPSARRHPNRSIGFLHVFSSDRFIRPHRAGLPHGPGGPTGPVSGDSSARITRLALSNMSVSIVVSSEHGQMVTGGRAFRACGISAPREIPFARPRMSFVCEQSSKPPGSRICNSTEFNGVSATGMGHVRFLIRYQRRRHQEGKVAKKVAESTIFQGLAVRTSFCKRTTADKR